MQSVYSTPNPVLFGCGVSQQTGERLKKLGCKKVLVVCDKGVKQAGIVDKIIDNIHAADIETVLYDSVQADPPDWSVDEAGALGVKENVDAVVGVGGGSSMDTAKGATLLQTNKPPINQYFGRVGIITNPGKPLFVIPTTAGTGSECSPGGVITDTKNGIKTNIAGAGCAVTLGLVDPELTVGMPPAVTAATGLDVFCHAFESYTSRLANSYSEVMGRESIRLCGKYLVRAYKDGKDMEAREGMMLASSLAGMAISGALCHLAHDIGKVVGIKYHVPHGVAGAVCLPQILEVLSFGQPEKLKYITEMIGHVQLPDDATPEDISKAAYKAGMDLIHDLDMPKLRDIAGSKEELVEYVPSRVSILSVELKKMFGSQTAPVEVTDELIADIISRAYDEN